MYKSGQFLGRNNISQIRQVQYILKHSQVVWLKGNIWKEQVHFPEALLCLDTQMFEQYKK